MSQINRLVFSQGAVFGETTYPPRGSCGPRIQTDFQLVCVLAGSARVAVDEREISIPQNHVGLMLPGHREHFLFDPLFPTHHTWCAVRPELVPEQLKEALQPGPFTVPLSQRMANLISAGLDFLETHHDGPVQQIGLACLHTYQFEASGGSGVRYPEHLTKTVSALSKDLARPWTVEEMAKVASVSPQHLIRLFRRYLGITPSRYLWDLRVQRGMAMLRETGLTVSEISERVGFSTPFHFARLTKARFGLSPRAVRAQAWSSDRLAVDVDGDRDHG